MRLTRRQRTAARAAALIVVVALVVGAIYWFRSWNTSETIKAGGGEVTDWRRDVSVKVEAGGVKQATRITFKDPATEVPQAPIDSLVDIIGEPVDIVPEGPLAKASITFYVDASEVPLSRTDSAGRPQRSIYNAGIQIFNTKLGWVPLETRVEGDKLTAKAPHFSLYRAVWVKTGEQQVQVDGQAITYSLAPNVVPTDLFMQTGAEFIKQMKNNATGRFDDGKFKCEPAHPEYTVTLIRPPEKRKLMPVY